MNALAVATAAAALAARTVGTGASSSSASRMMRRGSYWRGSSVRQSTSSKSEPISSFIFVFAVLTYSRARLANLVRLST